MKSDAEQTKATTEPRQVRTGQRREYLSCPDCAYRTNDFARMQTHIDTGHAKLKRRAAE